MSKLTHISSKEQFSQLLSSSTIVIADFFAEWCGPCKVIAPVFEQLANKLSRPNKVTFTKIDVDANQEVAAAYGVSAFVVAKLPWILNALYTCSNQDSLANSTSMCDHSMPTFIIFKNGSVAHSIRGANPQLLMAKVQEFASSIGSSDGNNGNNGAESSGEAGSCWLGGSTPKGYSEISDQIEIKGIDLLNCDNEIGPGRSLFAPEKPSGLSAAGGNDGKGKAKASTAADWVESDTDEQLMLYMPFQSSLKVHSLQITSLPPAAGEDDEEVPMRPKTIKLYTNRAHIIGFEDADDETPTQEVELAAKDWDAKTGTANVELRFVKFQRITSLVVYFVDGDGDGERIRVDRVRIFGEAGEKRDMGKLEKIGDEAGE
ncbi:hypothetical protein FQN52_005942 [Onygenales sp. PD_12]|nr:hypothetical protein FQN52_005942 [Onygenales sp. PD_12]